VESDGQAFADDGSGVTGGVGDGCNEESRKLLNTKVKEETFNWRINFSTIPENNLSNTEVQDAFQAAHTNWTHLQNPCGLSDTFGKSVSFAGGSDANSGVQNTPGVGDICNHDLYDFISLNSFGALDNYAVTCINGKLDQGDNIVQSADVKYRQSTNYTIRPGDPDCNNAVDIESLATHEFGHVWGLDDLIQGHSPALTMTTGGGYRIRCNSALSSLAKGDVLGIKAKY